MPINKSSIEVVDLRKRYFRKTVLDGISFTAEKGKITCLIGLNGAGKSTILKAIMGLTPVQGGSILIDGALFTKASYEKVAFVPDHLTMPLGMTIDAGIQWMEQFYSSWNTKRAVELLSFFKLNAADRIGNLSKGTAAKYNLLLGLSQATDYIIMDEQFSGIDLLAREQIAEVFSSELIEDRGVLITTHEIQEMEYLIDRAVLLKNGVINQAFDCEDMRSLHSKSVTDVMREVYQS